MNKYNYINCILSLAVFKHLHHYCDFDYKEHIADGGGGTFSRYTVS